MEHAAGIDLNLELRSEADNVRILSGMFPYGQRSHRPVAGHFTHEVFEPGAFREHVREGRDVTLTLAHDLNQPIASVAAGTLELRDEDAGLHFTARISPPHPSWTMDALNAVAARTMRGISPGFVAAPGAALVAGGLRRIKAATLHELAIVTRPAYAAQVEARTSANNTVQPRLLETNETLWR